MEAQTDGGSRARLIAAILEFLGGQDLLTLEDIKVALEREVDVAGPDAVFALQERLTADLGWAYYPPDPLARRIHHVLADRFLAPGSALLGAEHLASLDGAPGCSRCLPGWHATSRCRGRGCCRSA